MRFLVLVPAGLMLSGCIAQTALEVVTLPVRVVAAGVDAATTSQAERDRARGRAIREQEERAGRIARRCQRNPDRDECRDLPADARPARLDDWE